MKQYLVRYISRDLCHVVPLTYHDLPEMTLLYYCTKKSAFDSLQRKGACAEDGVVLHTSLAAAKAACSKRILVVQAAALDAPVALDEVPVRVPAVPPGAFCNLDPYLPPRPVEAGGGYVVRPGTDGPEVLLIFRRGVWDLPKGKRDGRETIEACALREVREEIGVKDLHLGRLLGTTHHGYPEGKRYRIKTTYWFLMRTTATEFTPEVRERIEKVAWMPWAEALETIGYDTLREHMRCVEPDVRKALAL